MKSALKIGDIVLVKNAPETRASFRIDDGEIVVSGRVSKVDTSRTDGSVEVALEGIGFTSVKIENVHRVIMRA